MAGSYFLLSIVVKMNESENKEIIRKEEKVEYKTDN